jgi:hypothetical protein
MWQVYTINVSMRLRSVLFLFNVTCVSRVINQARQRRPLFQSERRTQSLLRWQRPVRYVGIRCVTESIFIFIYMLTLATGNNKRSWQRNKILRLKYLLSKKFWEELMANFPWYDTGHIETDESNNSSIVACVFVTAVTFLPSRSLATIGGFLLSRYLATIGGYIYRYRGW